MKRRGLIGCAKLGNKAIFFTSAQLAAHLCTGRDLA